jgi:flagellar biosynthesis protein
VSEPQKSPLAVALHYEKPGAPRVVAKGRGDIGRRIIEAARANGVPLEENAALAEALAQVELEHAIPEALYRAVAEVLVFILRMSGKVA